MGFSRLSFQTVYRCERAYDRHHDSLKELIDDRGKEERDCCRTTYMFKEYIRDIEERGVYIHRHIHNKCIEERLMKGFHDFFRAVENPLLIEGV